MVVVFLGSGWLAASLVLALVVAGSLRRADAAPAGATWTPADDAALARFVLSAG